MKALDSRCKRKKELKQDVSNIKYQTREKSNKVSGRLMLTPVYPCVKKEGKVYNPNM